MDAPFSLTIKTRPTRDMVYLAMAEVLSQRSTCVRRQVACLLVSERGTVIATGYNGVPVGWPHCTDRPCAGAASPTGTDLEKCEAIHAEVNALLQCRNTDLVHTAYITDSPCVHCVKILLNTGCKRIVFSVLYPHLNAQEMWERDGRLWIQGTPLISLPRHYRTHNEA